MKELENGYFQTRYDLHVELLGNNARVHAGYVETIEPVVNVGNIYNMIPWAVVLHLDTM